MKNVTIEQLAEKLNQTVWTKGDLKRIYLNDTGHNTKKMSTKVYIYEKNGDFRVSVTINCPSQHDNWIEAQENELRLLFGDLRRFRDELQRDFQVELPELSMGMSDDYKFAAEEGATMIRIGRKLFK